MVLPLLTLCKWGYQYWALSLDNGKQKEVKFDKVIKPNRSFDMMAQLSNLPAQLTLYEKLCLSKETRKLLKEALKNIESFATLILQLQMMRSALPVIAIKWHDYQVPSLMGRTCPSKILAMIVLYNMRYVGSICIEQILIDYGYVLSIKEWRLLSFFQIPISWLFSAMTTIHSFNGHSSYPTSKFCMKCQLDDLNTEVTCHAIDIEMSYNFQ